MNGKRFRALRLAPFLLAGWNALALAAGPVLPKAPAPFTGRIGETLADSVPAFPAPLTARPGAPNVLLIMTDDVGYGAASTFGGPIPTPNLDKLAARGLLYNRFHTTAMCSPTRAALPTAAALLTGRNHHAVGNGTVANLATGYPGYWSQIPKSAATIAEVLKDNGYNTAMFGKHHNTPENEVSTAGPYDLWPLGLGFEHFFGFMAAETNQFTPALYRDNSPIASPSVGMVDKMLADETINYIHNQKAVAPDKPFFIYLAPGTAHAPHQAPQEWIDKFRGKFEAGWDAIRAATAARQIALRLAPPGTSATPRPDGITAWEKLSPEEKRVNTRMMEVFAGMLAYQDYQTGRILDELDRMGLTDDTLIVFVEGDNGAAAEAGPNGSLNPMAGFANGMRQDIGQMAASRDTFGGPDTNESYGFGWAWAMNAPFQLFKEYASHLGGIRNGMVVSWPARIKERGVRSQFTHIDDIMPTVLEAAHIDAPDTVNGTKQQPLDGVSFAYSFNAPKAPERHRTQYFEMLGNRGLYHNGWLANTYPTRLPWNDTGGPPTAYAWELYDLDTDYAQAHDLAASQPAKLREMQALFDQEARKNQVYPLDNRLNMARFMAGPRHSPRSHYTYWGAGVTMPVASAAPLLNRAFVINADLELPASPTSGTILALGGKFGGWSFYLEEGRPVATMVASQLPGSQSSVASVERLKPGKVRLSFDFRYDGGINGGGTMTILTSGRVLAQGRIARTISNLTEQMDTMDVGFDRGTPVVAGVGSTPFTGRIERVDLSLGQPTVAGSVGTAVTSSPQ